MTKTRSKYMAKLADIRVVLLLLVGAVWAGWLYGDEPAPQTLIPHELAQRIDLSIDVPRGGLDWKILAQTTEKVTNETDARGFTGYDISPLFSKSVKALNGRKVKLKGYMFPLEEGALQSRFLLGPFMPDCADHYHVAPSLAVEVNTATPMPVASEPVVVEGVIELLYDEEQHDAFYRMHGAVPVHE